MKGKNNVKEHKTEYKREMMYKDRDQDYAIVQKLCGDCRLIGICQSDALERQCHIRGKMKKKIWIKVGDVILVAFREFEKDKCDVIHKYSDEEAKILRKHGEIRAAIMEVEEKGMEENEFEFSLDQPDEINLDEI